MSKQPEKVSVPRQCVAQWTALVAVVPPNAFDSEIEPVLDPRVESAGAIYQLFLTYKEKSDFVGMDMARKFLQMGYTRSRRYANYKGGKKYSKDGERNERQIDEQKAESAAIFMKKWKEVRENKEYLQLKKEHQKKYG